MFGNNRRTPPAVAREIVKKAEAPRSLWRDHFGTLATRSVQIIAIGVFAAALVWSLHTITVVVIPVILALIFAAAFEPIMRRLRLVMPSLLATVIVLLAIVGVIGGVIWAMVRAILAQWNDLYTSAESGVQQILVWVNELPFAPDEEQLLEWWQSIQDFVLSAQFGSAVGSGALAGVSAIASFVTGLVLMTVVLFFFLKDGPQIWTFLIRPFEGGWRDRMERVGSKSVSTLGAYVRGTAAVAAVDAIGIGVGLAILQVPMWFPLMLVVFLLSFIPIVGATLAGILAALVGLVDGGLWTAIIIVIIVIGVNQLESNFLQPVLMGRTLKLHALAILVALMVGTVLAGILGAVLAVPLAAVAWGIIQVWDGENLPARWARPKEKKEL
ncbi:AI-2E family transporter [Microbacterium amylolyticum]|uniref:PurR-regulated permease PerM n=1 Tax=Microbacterium amylolyticum TaxID=936337 RepID=A0ABS4ZHY6_9MICO|nr:AI-2E family transporter [Microbacterium amylolyticum]MBP2436628.1 putative PurR-regulated permease PerM [Microbacterium amylolyticum]